MIVSEGTVPSDDGHSRANCEAVHKLASSIGDPIGSARGSGVVLVPHVEAPASSIGDPIGMARGSGVVFVPQVEVALLECGQRRQLHGAGAGKGSVPKPVNEVATPHYRGG